MIKNLFIFGAFMITNNIFSQPILRIHYHRLNNDCEGWKLWIWNESEHKNGFEIYFNGNDDFGVYAEVNLQENSLVDKKIGILPKYKDWERKESFDRFFEFKGQKDIFIIEGDNNVYESIPDISTKIISAFWDDKQKIRVILNRKINNEYLKNKIFKINCSETDYETSNFKLLNGDYSNVLVLDFEKLNLSLDLVNTGKCYFIFGKEKLIIKPGEILYKENFYSNEKMGIIFENDKTIFRVFSPNSMAVNLILKEENDNNEKKFPMIKKENGIWEYSSNENLEGKYYSYEVIYADKVLYGLDPYANSVIGDNKCAVIFNDKSYISESPKIDISDLIIYEMSLRDFSIDENSGIKNKGKYLALTEENTVHPKFNEIKTGISHLKELGINAVQIMPFFDFEKDENSSEYNWGYMPVNFNSPEGWFAVDKKGYSRVKELKEMISNLHQNGIKVIMDVVYNHTAETKDKIYNFNALSYDYYYRKKADSTYYNGSGCGNEFKTESPMGRKFIIDSLKYWIYEYKIDGFRFDLMGLIDIETIDVIIKELKNIKPDIIIYGEPWKAGDSPVIGVYKGAQKNKGFSVFNDNFRDAIKGNVFNIKDLGYIQNGNYREKIMAGIKGSIDDFTSSPLETINYVSCHDNNTLWDRINLSIPDESMENKIRMDKLAQAIIFISQGIPFIQSGEEFVRTKKGEENSYNLPDEINKIDWTRKKDFFSIFNFYKDLIKLRKEHSAFKLKTKGEINNNLKFYEEINIPIEKPLIAFILNGKAVKDNWDKILVLINPTKDKKDFILPQGKWKLEFDENGFVLPNYFFENKISVNLISLIILSQNL